MIKKTDFQRLLEGIVESFSKTNRFLFLLTFDMMDRSDAELDSSAKKRTSEEIEKLRQAIEECHSQGKAHGGKPIQSFFIHNSKIPSLISRCTMRNT